MDKIKEEDLKLIVEQQTQLHDIINSIGMLEAKKHGNLHDIATLNKEINEFKEVLEAEYGQIQINMEDGSYTKIEKENVEGNKED